MVIDPFSYFKYNPDEFIEVDPLELQVVLSSEMQRKRDLEQAEAMELVEIRPSLETQALNRARVRERRQFLLLMTPMLPGYSLNLNKWRKLPRIPKENMANDIRKSGCMFRTSNRYPRLERLSITSSFLKTRKV